MDFVWTSYGLRAEYGFACHSLYSLLESKGNYVSKKIGYGSVYQGSRGLSCKSQ